MPKETGNESKESLDKHKVNVMNEVAEVAGLEISVNAQGAVEISDAEQAALDAAELKARVLRDRVVARATPRKSNQPNVSDGMVGPATANMSPGELKMSATLKLHSTQAINLFRGRKSDPAKKIQPIIGLARFARQAAFVWSAAAIDDPYADQVIINIEKAFNEAKELLDLRLKNLTELLSDLEDFEVTIRSTEKPVTLTLQFYSPWGFRGALLLKQYDKLVRMALTANHVGLFVGDDWKNVVHDSGRALRHMFALVDWWISTGVKRADIRQNNRIAKRATSMYNDSKKGSFVLENEVLAGLYRAELSPANRILEQHLKDLEAKKAAAKKIVGDNLKKTALETEKVTEEHELENVNRNQGKPNFGFTKNLKKTDDEAD